MDVTTKISLEGYQFGEVETLKIDPENPVVNFTHSGGISGTATLVVTTAQGVVSMVHLDNSHVSIEYDYDNPPPQVVLGQLSTWPPEQQTSGKSVLAEIQAMIPGIEEVRTACPSKDCTYPTDDSLLNALFINIDSTPKNAALTDVIIHLNDQHKWSREQIADWLESTDFDLTLKKENQK